MAVVVVVATVELVYNRSSNKTSANISQEGFMQSYRDVIGLIDCEMNRFWLLKM